MYKYILLLFVLCAPTLAMAQKHQLSGIVKAAAGQAVPGAGVFIANSKMAMATDPDGKFSFMLDPGKYEVLVQMIGFKPGIKQVSLESGSASVQITIVESELSVDAVEIRPDKDRAEHLRIFTEFFIGKTPNALKTRLLNPEVLRTDFDPQTRKLRVSADEFVELENEALGYKIKYLLRVFEYDFKASIVYYEGFPTFEELPGSRQRQNRWERNRLAAYNGSLQQFYRSLAANTTGQEGFVLHKIVPLKESERSNLARPGVHITSNPGAAQMLRRENILIDTLVHKDRDGNFFLNFKDELYVIYENEREPANYNYSGFWQSRPLDIPNYQISKITPLKLPLRFYKNGGVADPTDALYSGWFAYEKVADQLPIEYVPPARL